MAIQELQTSVALRLKLRTLSRFRPRILTLIVFFAAAAVIALAKSVVR